MDGYHVSHDPAKPAVKEPTTGRLLNTLDVPSHPKSAPAPPPLSIPTGRGLSPSRIVHPKPTKHYASRGIREADYNRSPTDNVDDLTSQLELASLQRGGYSPTTSVSSGFSSGRSSGGSSPTSSLSSVSDRSTNSCRCNRYGITRDGKKVLLDCGGSKCGYSEDSSECGDEDSSEEEDDSEEESSEEESEDERRPVIRTVKPHATKHAPQPTSKSSGPKVQEIRPKAAAPQSSRSSASKSSSSGSSGSRRR